MTLSKAAPIAAKYIELLKPFAHRISLAGSLRRCKAEIKDADIIMIRKPSQLIALNNFITAHTILKGSVLCKHVRFHAPEGLIIELWFCELDNWGNTLAIRTGDAEFSHRVLACGWVRAGCEGKNGYLHFKTTGAKIKIYEEQDLFELIDLDWIPPEERDYEAYLKTRL
jgi:DNA polymerase/3'-5' exonuclease PolX